MPCTHDWTEGGGTRDAGCFAGVGMIRKRVPADSRQAEAAAQRVGVADAVGDTRHRGRRARARCGASVRQRANADPHDRVRIAIVNQSAPRAHLIETL